MPLRKGHNWTTTCSTSPLQGSKSGGKYNKLLWESLNSSDLAHRASNLAQQVPFRLSQSQQVQYESIDHAATKHKWHVENKCWEFQGQSNPLVSTSLQGNQSNPVLERTTKPTERMCVIGSSVLQHWAKSGTSNHSEIFHLHQRAAYSKFDYSHQVFWFTLLESNNVF